MANGIGEAGVEQEVFEFLRKLRVATGRFAEIAADGTTVFLADEKQLLFLLAPAFHLPENTNTGQGDTGDGDREHQADIGKTGFPENFIFGQNFRLTAIFHARGLPLRR